jgi:F-type H+-transporting ATPase subunit b
MLWFLISFALASGEGEAPAASAEHGEHAAASEEHGEEGAHHEGIPLQELAIKSSSLLIFGGILFALTRRPVKDALASRAAGIRKSIDEATNLRAESQRRYAEVEARLAGLDQKIKEMQANAEWEADQEAVRLREKAASDAKRMEEVAGRTIREETERARRSLREEAIRLSVGLARQKASDALTVDDQRRFAREFLDVIGKEVR